MGGCEYLLNFDRFAGAHFMGEVHLPAHASLWRGDDPEQPSGTRNSAEAVWQFFCSHRRFAMHGCEGLGAQVFEGA